MSAESISNETETQLVEPVESETIRRMRETLADGASYTISYAQDDIEKYGRYGDKPYAYFRAGKTVLRLVE